MTDREREALWNSWNLRTASVVAEVAAEQSRLTGGMPHVIGGRVFVGRSRAEAVAKAHRARRRGCTIVGPRLAPWQWRNLRS